MPSDSGIVRIGRRDDTNQYRPYRHGTENAENGRVYQSYLGKRLHDNADLSHLPQGREIYLTHGLEDYFEPAVEVCHNDNNPSLLLKYVSHNTKTVQPGVEETIIALQDDKYPVTVNLHYVAYQKENIIRTYTEISHKEKKPIALKKYASAMLHFDRAQYYLTEFAGDWADEAHVSTVPLNFGKKVVDTKLGTRANMFTPPFFILSLDRESNEREGEVILGTLGWTATSVSPLRLTIRTDCASLPVSIPISQNIVYPQVKYSALRTFISLTATVERERQAATSMTGHANTNSRTDRQTA